ncbi:hypothetical protein VTJ83DRAFT_5134 [Remersonia thermophila]|uniref:Uncharacterized protein n=1 Tax=Remersonia thermophila TaxID=72144 RepID=A0ABR4DE54_9PEZI
MFLQEPGQFPAATRSGFGPGGQSSKTSTETLPRPLPFAILQEASACGCLGMCRLVQDTQLCVHCRRGYLRSERNNKEGSLLPSVVPLAGKRPQDVDNLIPIERLNVWRCGIVGSQALQPRQGEGKKLVFCIEGLQIEEVALLIIRGDDQISISPERLVDIRLAFIGGGCLSLGGTHGAECRQWGFLYGHWMFLDDRHGEY